MKELKKYYRQIRTWFPGGRIKKELMKQIKISVQEYINNNPGISFSAVQAHFGSPQLIAAAFVSEMEPEELLRNLRVRRRIIAIIVCAVILMVAIFSISLLTAWLADLSISFGYTVISRPCVVR